MDREQTDRAVVFDFVAQYEEDRVRGTSRSLAEYLARFPECPEEIALEYCRLRGIAPGLGALPGSASSPAERYSRLGEIARGGMGRILLVRDATMRRDLAMKVALRGSRATQARLAEESLITGGLEHPGVVPVHDRGVDAEGRAYFTMRLVEGRDLREIVRMVHRREGGWSLPRALEVVLKVCDTVAYAHARGVVHRDLKAANVRVGSFGEVYVLDWGLAKSSERSDRYSPAAEPDAEPAALAGMQALTLDGDVIGTPCTMSPEQAAGRIHEIGPRSDVYSVGAMLYELLAGRMPYVLAGESPSSPAVLARVLSGPPEELKRLCPRASPELIAICEKAMAREPAARYPSMREMAADLRAYLELRVVGAYRTGFAAEVAKWITRNRRLSLVIAAAIAVAISALVAFLILQRRDQERLRLVADARAPQELVARFEAIHPDGPERMGEMEGWMGDAEDLLSRREGYQRELEALRGKARPWDRGAAREREAEATKNRKVVDLAELLAHYRGEKQRMEKEGGLSDERLGMGDVRSRLASFEEKSEELAHWVPVQLTWTFDDAGDQFRHDTIEGLLPALAPLLDAKGMPGLVSRMRWRIARAKEIEAQASEPAAAAWNAAIASIRDPASCPAYGGLAIAPQRGLVPLRRDPVSGLWEFLHRTSGDPPSVGPDGKYVLASGTGIVLVLLPGDLFELGAQRASPELPNYDPQAEAVEWTTCFEKPSTVPARLRPFLLSKYEMTQAQWTRLAGWNPSGFSIESKPEAVSSDLHPVEYVDWSSCLQLMEQIGLELPTEAQWEYAARAGTTTPWWTGADRESLRGAANLADRSSVPGGFGTAEEASDWPELDDGYACHAPVGSLRPNAFGLHEMIGNVSEWCRDAGGTSYDLFAEVRMGTHERFLVQEGLRVRRGGSYCDRASACRSSARAFNGPTWRSSATGLRPSRDLER